MASHATTSIDGDLRLAMYKPTLDGQGCKAAVVTPNQMMVTILAAAKNERARIANFCDLAGSVMHQVAAAIHQHKATHRTWPADSAGRLDMCALISKADLSAALPGLATDGVGSPGQHTCTWGDTSSLSSPFVEVTTTLFNLKPLAAPGDQMVRIAGRDTVVQPGPTRPGLSPYCTAETAVKTWPNGLGNSAFASASDGTPPNNYGPGRLIEAPRISVSTGKGGQPACHVAEDIAAKMWSHLPPAS
jgi:hypothetical protein